MSRDVPAPVHPDDRGAEEDERHETRPGRRGLIVEKGEDRHEHRADEAEPRDDLRRPVERERDSDSCDSGGQSQGYERRHQLVPGCGEEQRRVPAGDSGAGSGNRRVERAVARVREDTGGEDERRRDHTEQHALDRPDPAVARSRREEEDDAE
jgi:hypothetical protein